MALNVTLSPKQKAAIGSQADITFFGGGNGPRSVGADLSLFAP